MSPNKQPYYKLQLSKPVHTNKIQICLANSVNGGDNAVREIKFYEYNSLQDDVSALFKSSNSMIGPALPPVLNPPVSQVSANQ